MRTTLYALAAGTVLAASAIPTVSAAPIAYHVADHFVIGAQADLVQVKNDKAKKPKHLLKKPKKAKRPGKTAAPGKDVTRAESIERLLRIAAPEGRDMLRVLGATALALAAPGLVIADLPDSELITYRNCPPGLAKKDPPCVPPGLAKKGVTYSEWAAYNDDDIDGIWLDRRRELLQSPLTSGRDLLLSSDQIATLYGLAPAPRGQRYGLIDGLPVLLDDDDYDALLRLNQLAQVPQLGGTSLIAPTAALTQSDLMRLYGLPALGPDENYAVVNGQLLRISDETYEALQLIRIARAIR